MVLFCVPHLVVSGGGIGTVYIDEPLGADDLIALGDQDHLKAAVLAAGDYKVRYAE